MFDLGNQSTQMPLSLSIRNAGSTNPPQRCVICIIDHCRSSSRQQAKRKKSSSIVTRGAKQSFMNSLYTLSS